MKKNGWQYGLAVLLALAVTGCQREASQDLSPAPWRPVKQLSFSHLEASQLSPVQLGDLAYVLLGSEVRGLVLVDAGGSRVLESGNGRVEQFATQRQADGSWLIAAYDGDAGELQLRRLSAASGEAGPAMHFLGAVDLSAPPAALCFSQQAQRSHLFAIGEDGLGREFIVHTAPQAWQFSEVRLLYFGPQVTSCVVDDPREQLLVAQPPLGIWALHASAEADENRRVVVPGGALGEEFGGLWLDRGRDELWVANGARVRAYSLGLPPDAPVFERTLADMEPISIALQRDLLLALGEEGDRLQKYDVARPQAATGAQTFEAATAITQVLPRAQTQPVASGGDAADDPAIWVNGRDPSASLVLGTDKKHGLNVYRLDGTLVQQLPVGRVNNVDLRPVAQGRFAALAAASNRTTAGINLFGITADGLVEHLGLRPVSMGDPYGLCMYRRDGNFYAWLSDKDAGLQLLEIQLQDNGLEWQLRKVAELQVASQVEGCVVDDERGTLFFGEEDGGVWRLDIAAFLAHRAGPELVAPVDGGQLVADVEGMGLYLDGPHSYLVVSSQGNDSYVLFSRDGSEFVGRFRVAANLQLGIDGSSETDGLDVTSAMLGADYPQGLLVVQDGRNRMPGAAQNFKLVSWQDVMRQLPAGHSD
ncbi:phytase [Microbulbifer sp. 2201CG32-9]|uniref:phytase n=1 Tax=Microbulbifer sp. 2201CG32-9 TaxID=3232309 RepID=UPI00345C2B69